jgi:hypothetical protein
MKCPKMVSAEYVKDFTLRLSFSDGMAADVNFANELTGGVFEALKDVAFFRSFTFQAQFGTIEWRNGADFAPEFLYALAKQFEEKSRGGLRLKNSG